MTDAQFQAHMRQTMGPHLTAMREDFQKRFPDVDPEMMLLHWLCQKNDVEPPEGLQLKDGVASIPPPKAKAKLKAKTMTPRPPSESAPREHTLLSPRISFRRQLPEDPLSTLPMVRTAGSKGSSSHMVSYGSPSTRRTLARPPVIGKPFVTGALDLAQDSREVFPGEVDYKKGASLKSLNRLNAHMSHDTHKHLVMTEHLRGNAGVMSDMIAHMRQELRGQFLAQVPLISQAILTKEEQFRLVGKLRPWTFRKGESIITEGEVGDKLYIIERGNCEVTKQMNGREHVVEEFGKGSFFGEIACLYDIPRTATVSALTDVTVLSLSRDDLFSTVGEDDLHQMRVVARTQVFNSIPLLANLSSKQKIRVAEVLKTQVWYAGAILAGQSHITSRLFIIEHGTVDMEVNNTDQLPSFMKVTGKGISLGPGQFFGMRGLLYGSPVGFHIVASSDKVQTLSVSVEEILNTAKDPREREEISARMHESMQGYLMRQVPQLRHMADNFFLSVKSCASEVFFKKWTIILSKGTPIEIVYVLEQGKIIQYDGDATDLQELVSDNVNPPEHVTPGDYFGVECLTNKKACAPYTLVALTDVKLLSVPPKVVWQVLHEERQDIGKIPLLSRDVLTKAEQYMLVGKLKPWNFRAGRNIITQGEIGDMLFVIEKGECDAVKHLDGREIVISHMKKGSFFGELAVMFDMPRTATIRAVTDVVVLSLSREDLLSSVRPEKLHKMKLIARTRVFDNIPMFDALPTKQKVAVAEKMEVNSWVKGDLVTEATQSTDRVFIIEKGEVQLKAPGGTSLKLLAGQFFGMQGLLHGSPYGFTITAASAKVTALSISLSQILDTAGTGERPMLERTLNDSLRCYLLQQIPHLRDFSANYFQALLNRVEAVKFHTGDTVIAKGKPLNFLYVLEHGDLTEVLDQDDEEVDDLALSSHCKELERTCAPLTSQGEDGLTKIFGADCLHTARAISPATLIACRETLLLRVPPAVVRQAIRSR